MTIEYIGKLWRIRDAFRGIATVTALVGSNTARVDFIAGKTAADLPRDVAGCYWWNVTPAYRDPS